MRGIRLRVKDGISGLWVSVESVLLLLSSCQGRSRGGRECLGSRALSAIRVEGAISDGVAELMPR
jgi:hypothetical protein